MEGDAGESFSVSFFLPSSRSTTRLSPSLRLSFLFAPSLTSSPFPSPPISQLTVVEPAPSATAQSEDEISDPDEDTIEGQLAQLKGGNVKPKRKGGDEDGEEDESSEEESSSDEDGPKGKKGEDSSDSDSD